MNDRIKEAFDKIGNISAFVAENFGNADTAKYMNDIISIVQKAVSEPLKNCNVGTAEEQDERFENFCQSYYEPCNVDGECWRCPLFKSKLRCPIAWEQLPYEKDEEK